jgi:hypothetical protein
MLPGLDIDRLYTLFSKLNTELPKVDQTGKSRKFGKTSINELIQAQKCSKEKAGTSPSLSKAYNVAMSKEDQLSRLFRKQIDKDEERNRQDAAIQAEEEIRRKEQRAADLERIQRATTNQPQIEKGIWKGIEEINRSSLDAKCSVSQWKDDLFPIEHNDDPTEWVDARSLKFIIPRSEGEFPYVEATLYITKITKYLRYKREIRLRDSQGRQIKGGDITINGGNKLGLRTTEEEIDNVVNTVRSDLENIFSQL